MQAGRSSMEPKGLLLKDAKPVITRDVWEFNLEFEFTLIRQVIRKFQYVSMDTEFPGCVYRFPLGPKNPNPRFMKPYDHYHLLKANVDALKLIQVGLTFSDSNGNLPDLGTDFYYIWEFNFREFDVERDPHAPESIDLLRRQGINFLKNRVFGVDSAHFSHLMVRSGLLGNESVNWVTFQSAYDFGYLVKILTHCYLPDTLEEFLRMLRLIFGMKVYDVKHLMKFCDGLHGGLESVAKTLGVKRVIGNCHQAGSDSLLTWQAFQKIRDIYFVSNQHEKHAGLLYGLEIY